VSCARNSAQQYYHFSRIPEIYTKINLNHYDLAYLIDLFSSIQFGLEHRGKDIFGRIYETSSGNSRKQNVKKGGEFYTPRCLTKLIVEILDVKGGRILTQLAEVADSLFLL